MVIDQNSHAIQIRYLYELDHIQIYIYLFSGDKCRVQAELGQDLHEIL